MTHEGPCEAGAGVDDSGPGLRFLKCGKPGVWHNGLLLPYGVILCPRCCAAMARSGRAKWKESHCVALVFEVRDAEPTCGVPSPGGRMRCEFPPDHRIGVERDRATYHYGRDARGAWRSWPMRGVSDDVED